MRRTQILALALAALVALAPAATATERAERPHPDAMYLACRAVRTDDGPAVGCRWRPVREATGYRLGRVDRENGRTVIFRTDDPSVTRHIDHDVERGKTYGYVVQAFDADGSLIARSRLVRVTVGPQVGDTRPEAAIRARR